MPKKYTDEFKKNAVALAIRLGSTSKAASQLDIAQRTLQNWMPTDQKEKKKTQPDLRTNRNGEFSPRIDKKTSDRIWRYCRAKDLNKTHFVIACINERLDELEEKMLEALSKEELIQMIREMR